MICLINSGTNGVAMAHHGLIFRQDGATSLRMFFDFLIYYKYNIKQTLRLKRAETSKYENDENDEQ